MIKIIKRIINEQWNFSFLLAYKVEYGYIVIDVVRREHFSLLH